jgi:hypothetical protein
VANTAGATVGVFVTQAITKGVWGSRDEIIGNAAATGLLLGASIGLVEWLVLRVFLSGMVWWIPATSLGWAVGLMTNAYLLEHGTYPESTIEFAVAIGAAVSLAQYITFWRRIPLAELWILVSVVAWVTVVITMPEIGHFTYSIGLISGHDIPGWLDVLRNLVLGVWLFGVLETATGLTLIWLLRRALSPLPPSTGSVTSA